VVHLAYVKLKEKYHVLCTVGKMAGLLDGFLKGLKKSFNGKDYLRNINQCNMCGRPSFFSSCLKCEVDEAYKGYKYPHKDQI
jgi:ribosomal protein S14